MEKKMKCKLFVQANDKQITGALVAAYAAKRFSKNSSKFDIQIMHCDEFPLLRQKHGEKYLREGRWQVWRYDFLQSFTPTRFAPPALMDYTGRSVVIDPDVFFVEDIWDLFSRDMKGKAILARPVSRIAGEQKAWATSVMLLDNEKLKHWDMDEQFNSLFEGVVDYEDWISLRTEPEDIIGELEPEWNDFDRLTRNTKALHNTFRRTQPWKCGLPIDFNSNNRILGIKGTKAIAKCVRYIFGDNVLKEKYRPHPDKNQENLFLSLVKEMLDKGEISREFLVDEMKKDHVRHDLFEVLSKAPTVEQVMNSIGKSHVSGDVL